MSWDVEVRGILIALIDVGKSYISAKCGKHHLIATQRKGHSRRKSLLFFWLVSSSLLLLLVITSLKEDCGTPSLVDLVRTEFLASLW